MTPPGSLYFLAVRDGDCNLSQINININKGEPSNMVKAGCTVGLSKVVAKDTHILFFINTLYPRHHWILQQLSMVEEGFLESNFAFD